MSVKGDYSPEEWDLLRGAVIGASVAVMLADLQSGITGLVREQTAFAKILAAGVQLEPGNTLVAALAQPGEWRRADVEDAVKVEGSSQKEAAAEALGSGRDRCARAADLLDSRSTPEEADGYRRWVMGAAEATARAAKEGTLLRGGPRISAAEADVLAELGAAIRWEGYVAPPVG
ncbi:MAG: hypothetical protein WCH74_11775 [Chloroflexota bacterium]